MFLPLRHLANSRLIGVTLGQLSGKLPGGAGIAVVEYRINRARTETRAAWEHLPGEGAGSDSGQNRRVLR